MLRLGMQAIFFVIFLLLLKGSCLVYPLGWSEYLTRGGTVIPLAFIVIVGFLIVSILWGRIFCGWARPVGFILDIESRIERRLGRIKKHSEKTEKNRDPIRENYCALWKTTNPP